VLGEETARPRTAIPRAILAAVLVGAFFYVFVTWSMAVGYGVSHADVWAKDPTALDTLSTRYAGTWLSILVDLCVAANGFVAALAGVHLTARTLLAMGRDGGLPRAFAWTHPRWRSPWTGVLAAGALTILLGAWLGNHYGPFIYFAFMATTASLAILFVYVLVAGGGMVLFWRERASGIRYNPVLDILLPGVAIALCGYTIYKSIEPVPPHPINEAPYISGAWLLLGLVVLAFLWFRRPEKVRTFGAALAAGEGGGEPATVASEESRVTST
jgi:amino acid transporter